MTIARDPSLPTPATVGATGTITGSGSVSFSTSNPATLWAVVAIGNYDGLSRTPYGFGWVGGTPAGATAWEKVGEALNGGTHAAQVWRATATLPLSSAQVAATANASMTNGAARIAIEAIAGANPTPGVTAQRTTNGTAAAGSIALACQPGSWALVAGCLEEPGAVTPVAGTTETGESVGMITAAVGVNQAGGSVTVGWSQSFTYGALLAVEILAAGPATEDQPDTGTAREGVQDDPVVTLPATLGPEDRAAESTTSPTSPLALATGQHLAWVVNAGAGGTFDLTALVTAVALGQLRVTIDGVVVATPSFDGDPFQTYNESVADVMLGRDTASDALGGPFYELPADRATLWSLAGLATVGGSRAFSGRQVYTTLASGATAAQVQAALDACPVGQVVVGPPGQVSVTGAAIAVRKGITWRKDVSGTRAVRTSGGGAVVSIGNGTFDINQPIGSTNLASPGAKGDWSVQVASTTGLAVGDVVLLDERFDGSRWVWTPQNTDWDQEWPFLRDDGPPYSQTVFRPQNELKEIAAINGTVVTFTSPLHRDYRTTFAAQLSRYDAFVKYAGLEGVEVSGGQDGNVRVTGAAYSWVTNHDNHNWMGEGVALHGAFRCNLTGSYIHDTDYPHPGGVGYAISLAAGTSEVLVENNITIRVNKNIVGRSCGAGAVVGYNYFDDAVIDYALNFPEVGINLTHMIGSHDALMEGNYGQNIDADFTHGNSLWHTYFRNWANGRRRNSFPGTTESSASRCAALMNHSLYHSFVGNVLGFPGMASASNPSWTEEDNTGGDDGLADVWRLGYDGITWEAQDPQVPATTIRYGNRDCLTGLQKFYSAPQQPIPDSLYLSRKPDFFGAFEWPWVTPSDPAIWTRTLPAKARYDAGTPMAVIEDPTIPVMMPLISAGVPVVASAGTASYAVDDSFGGNLWGFHRCELNANGTLALDLSSVPAAQRQRIVVALYQGLGDGQQQINFRALGDSNVWQNVAGGYVLEGGTSSSGPWTALATVAQNCQHFKPHLLTFAGYTWLRFRATSGTPYLDLAVYDASQGVGDGIAIFGDSITSNAFSDADVGAPPEWMGKAIRTAHPGFFPPIVGGGIPFMTAGDARSIFVDGTGGFTTGLDQPGRLSYAAVRYVALAYGANDAPAQNLVDEFRAHYQALIAAFRQQGQVVALAAPTWATDSGRQAGLVQIRGTIGYHLADWAAGSFSSGAYTWRGGRVYRCTTAGTSVTGPTGTGTGIADGGTARWAYVPSLREDFAADPQVIAGPDLYTTFLNHPEWLGDGLHPSGSGSGVWKQTWIDWALSALYSKV